MGAMVDVAALKARQDLAGVLRRELGEPVRGRQWLCPFHEEGSPSFGVVARDPGRAHCFGCGWSGDVIDFIRQRHGVSFAEACRLLGAESTPERRVEHRPPAAESVVCPPSAAWQARAAAVCEEAEATLWDSAGNPGRDYLEARGIEEETAWRAGLGYLPEDRREAPAAWGLTERERAVWLPAGIVFPWRFRGNLWRLNVRRLEPEASPKYIGPPGWRSSLYAPELLSTHRPVVLVEGEFDALMLWQEAGDWVCPVATGSATGARDRRWVCHLARAPLVLVAFDTDAAGEEASRWWLGVLPVARRLAPQAHDVAEMRSGIREWVGQALGPAERAV